MVACPTAAAAAAAAVAASQLPAILLADPQELGPLLAAVTHLLQRVVDPAGGRLGGGAAAQVSAVSQVGQALHTYEQQIA